MVFSTLLLFQLHFAQLISQFAIFFFHSIHDLFPFLLSFGQLLFQSTTFLIELAVFFLQLDYFLSELTHFLKTGSLGPRFQLIRVLLLVQKGIESSNILGEFRCVEIRRHSIFFRNRQELSLQLFILIYQICNLILHLLLLAIHTTTSTHQLLHSHLQIHILLFQLLDLIFIVQRQLIVLIFEVINFYLEVVVLIAKLEVLAVVCIKKGVIIEGSGWGWLSLLI